MGRVARRRVRPVAIWWYPGNAGYDYCCAFDAEWTVWIYRRQLQSSWHYERCSIEETENWQPSEAPLGVSQN